MCVDGDGLNPPTILAPNGGVMLLVAAPALSGPGFAAASALAVQVKRLVTISVNKVRIVMISAEDLEPFVHGILSKEVDSREDRQIR